MVPNYELKVVKHGNMFADQDLQYDQDCSQRNGPETGLLQGRLMD